MLRRLPKMVGAVLFTIRTHITPVTRLFKEPGVPSGLARVDLTPLPGKVPISARIYILRLQISQGLSRIFWRKELSILKINVSFF